MSQPVPSSYPSVPPKQGSSPLSHAPFLTRLTGTVALLNLLVFALVGFSIYQSRSQYQERAEITTQNLTHTLESKISSAIKTDDLALLVVIDEYKKQRVHGNVDGKVLNAYIERMRSRLPEIDALRITDAQGMLVYGNDVIPSARISLADRPHFVRLRDNPRAGLVISKPQVSRVNHKWVIVFARRIDQPDGSFGGMAFAAITLNHLTKAFSNLSIGAHGIIALRDGELRVVVRYPEFPGVGSAIGSKAMAPDFRKMMEAGQSAVGFVFRSHLDQVERTYTYRKVGAYPLYIGVGLASEEYLSQWRNEAAKLVSLTALFTLITLLAAWLILRLWKHQLDVKETLRESEERWKFALEGAGDGVWDWNIQAGETLLSKRWKEMIGYTEDGFGNGHETWKQHLHPDDKDRVLAALQDYFDGNSPIYNVEFRLRCMDGGYKWILARGMLVSRSEDGKPLRMIGTHTDITERKQSEHTLKEKTDYVNTIFDSEPECVKVVAEDGELLEMNQAGLNLLEVDSFEEARDYGLVNFILPKYRPLFRDLHNDVFQGKHGILELEIKGKRGGKYWLETHAAPLFDENGKIKALVGVTRNITESKQAEQQLRIAATAFESQEGMVVTDADSKILRVNQAFINITGYTAKEVVGKKTNQLKSGRHDAAFYAEMWESLRTRGVWQGEIWDRRKNGEMYPEWLTITAVKGDTGEITHYVSTLTDITLRKAAADEIKILAFYDPLTQLPNRRLLIDRLKHALASSTRSGRGGALLFIDLDNFKTLNDTLGHNIGDLLLQQVAERLTSCVREGDTAARLGGDEFVVMLEDLSEQDIEAAAQAKTIGHKILDILNQPYQLAGHDCHSTPSIGATLFNKHKSGIEELLKQADIAMYQAKTSGRNALRFFDPQMQNTINARAALEDELRKALASKQFHLYYQIQVDGKNRPMGAEALIRWLHPERGLVFPAQFIALAEETGLILPIGQWVLDTACAQLKAWQQDALTRALSLSVNVSAKQFRQPDFVAQLEAAVQRHAIKPSLLKLELTESMLLENIEETVAKMNALKDIGVRISLDDFGTGYSSLQYLKRLPLDQLKIDQSFVRDLALDNSDKVIVRTIIAMAQSLNLDVIAEGVETEDQRQLLLNKGCSHYQGYLFDRPVPIEQFEAFLKQG